MKKTQKKKECKRSTGHRWTHQGGKTIKIKNKLFGAGGERWCIHDGLKSGVLLVELLVATISCTNDIVKLVVNH